MENVNVINIGGGLDFKEEFNGYIGVGIISVLFIYQFVVFDDNGNIV